MPHQTIQKLIDMGYNRENAVISVTMSGNVGVGAAIEWMINHGDETGPPTSQRSLTPDIVIEMNPSTSPPTKSYKCLTCNKLYTYMYVVEHHAALFGHFKFLESLEERKLLTDEEKKELFQRLEERLQEKRKEWEAKEKKEELEKEKIRICSGKMVAAAKKNLADDSIKKIMDEKKREKQEEKIARDRFKSQIEADKLARKKLFGQVSGQEQPKQVIPVATGPQKLSNVNYTKTKLQIRLTNGQIMVETFNVREPLAAVRAYIELNRTDGDFSFCLMTHYPWKIFTNDDYEKPLDQLGLVPSGFIILAKLTQ